MSETPDASLLDEDAKIEERPLRSEGFKEVLADGAILGATTALCVMVPIGLVGSVVTLFDPA